MPLEPKLVGGAVPTGAPLLTGPFGNWLLVTLMRYTSSRFTLLFDEQPSDASALERIGFWHFHELRSGTGNSCSSRVNVS